ncbi:MAG: hypothetical protein ABGY95_10085 [Rubritalea sp.]|uniref:hypothetical protein n=1 Tax=Rubritalea sp. TaxID=2109375 RepID=UPI0032425EC0
MTLTKEWLVTMYYSMVQGVVLVCFDFLGKLPNTEVEGDKKWESLRLLVKAGVVTNYYWATFM